MKAFSVLSSEQKIYSNYLLEASAGTGKTFSIENVVVRLLLEEHPTLKRALTIQEILIVTFTRAATRDLIKRVRCNLTQALDVLSLKKPLNDPLHYLHLWLEEEKRKYAIRLLEEALFCFDQAQIYTIHGFCSKMLRENLFEGNVSLETNFSEQLKTEELQGVVRDVLRSELTSEKFSSAQLLLALNTYHGKYEKFERSLIRLAEQEFAIPKMATFYEEYQKFCTIFKELKEKYSLDGRKIYEDFEKLRPLYKKISVEKEEAVRFFCELLQESEPSTAHFNCLLQEGLAISQVLDPSLRLKRVPKGVNMDPSLHYPELLEWLNKELVEQITRSRSPEVTMLRLAKDCKEHLTNYSLQEEKMHYSDLLKRMYQAMQNTSFKKAVQAKVKVAIVDEFQDTDQLQWEIFKELFYSDLEERFLYLVGDPKQAIYSFRQADIYTYLSAASTMGSDHVASLSTNYRSTPVMIEALNTLFSESLTPSWIPLPRMQSFLPYRAVQAGKESSSSTDKEAVKFMIATGKSKRGGGLPLEEMENETFFPLISSEINRLCNQGDYSLSSFALLVSDRYQGERLATYLKQQGIPFALQRNSLLTDTPAPAALKDLLQAAIDPHDMSFVKQALGGLILQYTHEEILSLDQIEYKESILERFYLLKRELLEKGFASFYEKVLASEWHHEEGLIIEQILGREGGCEFYDQLQQVAEILMEYEATYHAPPEQLITLIEEFPTLALNDDPKLKCRQSKEEEAVTIVTMHSSKGLEYEVVFALGVIKRSPTPKKIVPVFKENSSYLKAVLSEEDPDYIAYCEELDAEKMRQLYVALTRAKELLYIPIAEVAESKVAYGSASPMDLLLARVLQEKVLSYEELYQRIPLQDLTLIKELICNHSGMGLLSSQEETPILIASRETLTLQPPKSVTVPGFDLFMQSFSSLTKNSTHSLKEETPPHDFLAEEKTIFTLPAGSETGNLLHIILEKLSFQEKNCRQHVLRYTRGTKYEEWTGVISEMVKTLLKTPIGPFTLQEVLDQSTYREMEFVYPIDSKIPFVEEVNYLPGYLKGIIDLVLKFEGKYYIIDWKSNWLGSKNEDYTEEKLLASLEEHHYFLQAALYKEALKRYLAFVEEAPFEEIFGGAYYLFVRGIGSSGVIKLFDKGVLSSCMG